jgi:DNA primase
VGARTPALFVALRIPEEKIEEVRAATDILAVVQAYVGLKKRGQNWFGLCPFHPEDTPSFSVHAGKQIFRCFGCGKGGNVFGFVMEIEKVTFTEAVRLLAEKAGIELPKWQRDEDEGPSESELLIRANTLARDFFYQQLINETSPGAREAKDYLTARGYGRDVIERFLIGYAPDTWESLAEHARAAGVPLVVMVQAGLLKEGKEKHRPYDAFRHRVMFPIRNLAGRVIAFGGRRLREENESESAKYINSPETSVYKKGREVFGLWEARNEIRKRDRAVIVEGYTDCASLVMAGVSIAVASLGTSLTTDQARLVKRFTSNIFIFYDGDNAGLAAAKRAADLLLSIGTAPRVVVVPADEDPDSYVQKHGGEAAWELINAARSPVEFQLEYGDRLSVPRKATVRELVTTAGLIASPVDQDIFVREVAARTGVSLDALRREVSRQVPVERDTPTLSRSEAWPKPGLLTTLTEILVRRVPLRDTVFEQWTPAEVEDPHLKELLGTLYSEWQAGVMRQPENLLNEFSEPPLRDFISRAMFGPEGSEDDLRRQSEIDQQLALDCLRKLEATRVREQIQRLRERLGAAGGTDMTMMQEMQVLLKKEKELHHKTGGESTAN